MIFQSSSVLQCRELPESACRMRVLKLFRDIGAEYRWTEARNYQVVIRTKVGQEGVCRLLEKELLPSIPYRMEVGWRRRRRSFVVIYRDIICSFMCRMFCDGSIVSLSTSKSF